MGAPWVSRPFSFAVCSFAVDFVCFPLLSDLGFSSGFLVVFQWFSAVFQGFSTVFQGFFSPLNLPFCVKRPSKRYGSLLYSPLLGANSTSAEGEPKAKTKEPHFCQAFTSHPVWQKMVCGSKKGPKKKKRLVKGNIFPKNYGPQARGHKRHPKKEASKSTP